MNLIAIKHYYKQNPVASAVEIASHFNVTPAEISCYLSYWEHRGNLITCSKSCASGCDSCFKHGYKYYTWQES